MICDGHTRELERDAMGLLVTHANNDRQAFGLLADDTEVELLWALCCILLADLEQLHTQTGAELLHQHIFAPLNHLDRFHEPDVQAARALNLALISRAGWLTPGYNPEIKVIVRMFEAAPARLLWQVIEVVTKAVPMLTTPMAVEGIRRTLLSLANSGHPDTPET